MTVYRSQFTYSATSTAFTPGATPVDVFNILGSATTNVYVLKMGLSTTQGADGTNAWYIAKRSTAPTAGTSAQPAIVPFDSNNPVATAVVSQYTANATGAGTLVGYVWGGWVYSPIVSTVAPGNNIIEVNFEDMFGQPVSLLSASESLAWNFKGAALPAGLSVIATVEWTEVSKT